MMIFKKWYMDSNEWFDSFPYKERVLMTLIFLLISIIVLVFSGDYQWLWLLVWSLSVFNWRYWYVAKKVDGNVNREFYKRAKRR